VSGAARLLRLAEADNVYIATGPLRPGDVVRPEGRELPITEPVDLGHKVAARPIEAGEKIIRFGMPIGSATQAIAAGAWVHTHNLASDYIRTFDHRGGDGHA
jgi:altronate dehydratase small subunit